MRAIQHVSKDQRRAIQAEANRAARRAYLAEGDKMNTYMDAAVLYALHEVFGFGKVRLKRFYTRFGKVHRDFVNAFAADEDEQRPAEDIQADMAAYYLAELKRIGVDVEKWRKEEEDNGKI